MRAALMILVVLFIISGIIIYSKNQEIHLIDDIRLNYPVDQQLTILTKNSQSIFGNSYKFKPKAIFTDGIAEALENRIVNITYIKSYKVTVSSSKVRDEIKSDVDSLIPTLKKLWGTFTEQQGMAEFFTNGDLPFSDDKQPIYISISPTKSKFVDAVIIALAYDKDESVVILNLIYQISYDD